MALAALWWNTITPKRSLATRLPADAVLFYAEFTGNDATILQTVATLAPSLTLPTLPPSTNAIAAVQGSNGYHGWFIQTTDQFGTRHIVGSDPQLATIIDAPGSTLQDDSTFRLLHMGADTSWAFLAFPRLSPDGSTLQPVLSLKTPLAVRLSASGVILRQQLDAPRTLTQWTAAPMATPPNLSQTLLLPSWDTMRALSVHLSPNALDVAVALSQTFFQTVAGEKSMTKDAAVLLHTPSILLLGHDGSGNTVFSLEGNGRSVTETEQILRAMHEHFAEKNGTVRVTTVSAEGYSFQTIAHEEGGTTEEQQNRDWTILTTRTDNGSLASAQKGSHFVMTTAPDALFLRSSDSHSRPLTSSLTWNEDLKERLTPLWPSLRPAVTGQSLTFTLLGGLGFVEWSLGPISTL